MSVILVCPTCGDALAVKRLPGPAACPHCFQPFPEAARAVVTRELETAPYVEPVRAERPFLLTAWMGVSSLYFAGLVLMLLASAVFAESGWGSSAYKSAGAFFLKLFLTVGTTLLTGAGASGIWRERSWTRPVLLATWVWVAVAGVLSILVERPPSEIRPAGFDRMAMLASLPWLLVLVVGLAVSWWYLYRKPNVVAYFDAMERGRRAG